jgi:hypothetical protein
MRRIVVLGALVLSPALPTHAHAQWWYPWTPPSTLPTWSAWTYPPQPYRSPYYAALAAGAYPFQAAELDPAAYYGDLARWCTATPWQAQWCAAMR